MKYKWFFDESGVLTECEPKLDNDTKLEFAPETDEMFYRAKLSGALTFQNEFDAILAKNFGYTHIVVLKRYSDTDNDYVEVWRGKFTLTDCTINYDRKTIEVTPKTIDRYTDVIAALETDYNIVKLAPQMHPVNINIRPCLQVYCYNSSKISNYIGHNAWEADCTASTGADVETKHFVKVGEYFSCEFVWNYGDNIGQRGVYWAKIPQQGEWVRMSGWVTSGDDMASDDSSLDLIAYEDGNETKFNVATAWLHDAMFVVKFDKDQPGTISTGVTVTDNRAIDVNGHWDAIGVRLIVNTELNNVSILGNTYPTYDFDADDFAGHNANYNKIVEYASGIEVVATTECQPEQTEWGKSLIGDYYFVKPANTATRQYKPVGITNWAYVSFWYYDKLEIGVGYCMEIVDNTLKKLHQIKDCYDLRNTIFKLLQKAGWAGQYVISGVFGTRDYVGANLLPIITPKSNVISSYYDTPAQNAPISLSKIFRMLKQAYKVYWYIDENNNLHLEHISYFQNGYSYTELPQTLVDLESDLHTRTRHSKAYGQNVVKFDKSGMAAVIAFGWMDKQTVPFDGYDIKALDSYVEQGAKEENTIADFSTDVDFVLSSPNDVSKDGFFLFALPNVSPGVYSNTLKIEKINITDENGDNYDVTIQNGDAAFCKIHKTFWRYDMPCENLQINNVADTALTTGRFKTQSLEFSDLAMADVISNVDNCIKLIKTQQGFGAIAKLSINLNSLATTADLVFTLFGRKYYLKGAALNGALTITLNGEQITITVSNNRFVYGYIEPINELKFAGTDVVSVDFADTDTLAELTSADDMFKNCAELIAVNFANKAFGAVTTANDMFKGCSNLVDLICPATESWKPDIDFSDCPNLTLQSLNDLIVDFLYQYDSGVHTITPNGTMWNALTAEQQIDIMAKATAKGWQIGVPAQYALKGTSTASAVYATINGAPVEIEVVAGAFRYEYNLPITSISFENDSNVTAIDFTESDLLAGITSLNDAFKGCAALQTVDFTGCDLSNVATATDCFSGCVALTSIVADSGVWQPDLDLSDSAMAYADMLSTISILYTYSTGVHTITFNSTVWDSFSQAQQQTISDAASAKGWTTNAVAVVYVIRGTSSNVGATETFNIQYINDGAANPSPAEAITCNVDANGNWEFSYVGKKIYSLTNFAYGKTTLLSCDFSNAESEELLGLGTSGNTGVDWGAFSGCANLVSANFAGLAMNKVRGLNYVFKNCSKLISVDFSAATFQSVIQAAGMFMNCVLLTNITWSNALSFDNLENVSNVNYGMFYGCTSLPDNAIAILNTQTFPKLKETAAMFQGCSSLTTIKLNSTTLSNCEYAVKMCKACSSLRTFEMKTAILSICAQIGYPLGGMFEDCGNLETIDMSTAELPVCWETTPSFKNCTSLTTINVPQNSTAFTPDSNPSRSHLNFQYSPLTYASMLKVVNWLSNLTGQNALTCTFNSTAWNALSAAEQATIQGILQSKNWNLATA